MGKLSEEKHWYTVYSYYLFLKLRQYIFELWLQKIIQKSKLEYLFIQLLINIMLQKQNFIDQTIIMIILTSPLIGL